MTAGTWHTCGIRADNTVACWGSNSSGQSDAPGGGFRAVTAGSLHTCGLGGDGAVSCWGSNASGQIDAPPGAFLAVSAGTAHSCGVRADRAVVCWGHNGFGQIDAPSGAFLAVSAGRNHSCGVRVDGTVECWGWTSPAGAAGSGAGAGFVDVDDTHFAFGQIEALRVAGTLAGTGCGPQMFCPGDPIPRWMVAVWMVRIVDGADPDPVQQSRFADVDAAVWWAPHVERLAGLGITAGCRDGTVFCPDRSTSRAEMATFLTRAFSLSEAEPAGFDDIAGSVHEDAINRLAAAGITSGCGDGTSFCPLRPVSRSEMAAFLGRALQHLATQRQT